MGGSFLLPWQTYNERLSPIWIGNFQDGPISSNIGLMSAGLGVGGQVRGSAISRRKYSLAYAAYFSALSTNSQFTSERSSGGRTSLYLPEKRLEVGFSYNRLLQGTHENFFGTYAMVGAEEYRLPPALGVQPRPARAGLLGRVRLPHAGLRRPQQLYWPV